MSARNATMNWRVNDDPPSLANYSMRCRFRNYRDRHSPLRCHERPKAKARDQQRRSASLSAHVGAVHFVQIRKIMKSSRLSAEVDDAYRRFLKKRRMASTGKWGTKCCPQCDGIGEIERGEELVNCRHCGGTGRLK